MSLMWNMLLNIKQEIVFELLCDVPEIMAMMWHVLRNIQEERGWFTCVGEYVFAFHTMSHIIYSAIAVQMVGSQVDAMVVKLNNILVNEHDMKQHDEISRLLQLMSARHLQHDVLGVVPTDMRLPVVVVELCVTYLIVIVQFTHLYD
ncbi:uncharacterized protein LOC126372781 isoform X2 [Pectinophora gossypiella]|uniref:uncharacterized protein LOC126372781 isoform X2 n=1 Tax=Pectinophora gossypiella TaxID=13191 RepID=UPI00214E0807|nr:uncharacterized protein LOC126372781 isoform X2 [Pectinophora gossypiella]